jgi:hypothetical protein
MQQPEDSTMSESAEHQETLYFQLIHDMDAELQVNPDNASAIKLAYYEQHKIMRARLRDGVEYRLAALARRQGDEAAVEREDLKQRLASFDRVDDEENLNECVEWCAEFGMRYKGWDLEKRKKAYDDLMGWLEKYPQESSFRVLLKEWDGINAQLVGVLYAYSYRSDAEKKRIRQILQNVEFFVPNNVEEVTTFFPELDPQDLRNWPMELLRSIEKLAEVSPGKCEEAIGYIKECWNERLEKEEEELWGNPNSHEGIRIEGWMKVQDVREALRRYGIHSAPENVDVETENEDVETRTPTTQWKDRVSPRPKTTGQASKPLVDVDNESSPGLIPESVHAKLLSVLPSKTFPTAGIEEEEEDELYKPPPAGHELVDSLGDGLPTLRHSRPSSQRGPTSAHESESTKTPASADIREKDEREYEPSSSSVRVVSSTSASRSEASGGKMVSTTGAGPGKKTGSSSENRTSPANAVPPIYDIPSRKTEPTDPGAKQSVPSKTSDSVIAVHKKPVSLEQPSSIRISLRSSTPKRHPTLVGRMPAVKRVSPRKASSSKKALAPKSPDSTNAGVKKVVSQKKVSSTRTSPRSKGSKRQIAVKRALEQKSAPASLTMQAQAMAAVTRAPQTVKISVPTPQAPTVQTSTPAAPQRRRKRKRREWGDRTYQPSSSVRKKVKQNNDVNIAKPKPCPVNRGRKIAKPKVKQPDQSSSPSKSSKGNSGEGELAPARAVAKPQKGSLKDTFAEMDLETSGDGNDSSDSDRAPGGGSSKTSGGGGVGVSEDELAIAASGARVEKVLSTRVTAVVLGEEGDKVRLGTHIQQDIAEQEAIEQEIVEQQEEILPKAQIRAELRRQSDGKTSAFFRHSLGASMRAEHVGGVTQHEEWTGTNRFPGVQLRRRSGRMSLAEGL